VLACAGTLLLRVKEMSSVDTVAVVGLGTMGRPMAMNLMRAGYPLRVYNRTAGRTDCLAGVYVAESPSDAAQGADVIITNVTDCAAVREVVDGEHGVLGGCASGAVVVDMSTIAPDTAREIASRCARCGVDFLDAPVTGGESGAISATLSIMVGGDPDVLERVRPVLECLGQRITRFGPVGCGQAAKLCNQIIGGLNILAVSEGLALAESLGLDQELLIQAVSTGAAGSWMLSNLGPKMLADDMAPGFRVRLHQKDLGLALDAAASVRLPLPGSALLQQLFRTAEAMGCGEDGTQSLYKVMRVLGAGSAR